MKLSTNMMCMSLIGIDTTVFRRYCDERTSKIFDKGCD